MVLSAACVRGSCHTHCGRKPPGNKIVSVSGRSFVSWDKINIHIFREKLARATARFAHFFLCSPFTYINKSAYTTGLGRGENGHGESAGLEGCSMRIVCRLAICR